MLLKRPDRQVEAFIRQPRLSREPGPLVLGLRYWNLFSMITVSPSASRKANRTTQVTVCNQATVAHIALFYATLVA